MKFLDAVKNLKRTERLLWVVIASLGVIVLLQSIGIIYLSTNKVYRVSIPPKLEFGAVINTGDIDPFEVYSFTGYITQQLYYWDGDGEVNFKDNINKLNAFITPAYRQYLLSQYQNLLRLGELTGRERSLQAIEQYDGSSVKERTNGWLVGIDYQLEEHINDRRFKRFNIRYFQEVVLRDVNPEANPWGLQLDIPKMEPLRIKEVTKKRGQ